ncbi:MAG: hypothetical protein Q4C34_01945 [Bacteroidales bacterium]|nr:hypothetical protein [Bacteroidales bacterium]
MTTQDIHDDKLQETFQQGRLPEESEDTHDQKTPAEKVKEPARYRIWAILSIVIAVIAWLIAGWNGYAGLATGVISIVAGALALRSHRHGVRNTAITAIIASGVLVVVLTAFIIVIYLGLNAI